MTFVDLITAMGVIGGFVYLIIYKMNQKKKGKGFLEFTKPFFNLGELINKKEEIIKEDKERIWQQKAQSI